MRTDGYVRTLTQKPLTFFGVPIPLLGKTMAATVICGFVYRVIGIPIVLIVLILLAQTISILVFIWLKTRDDPHFENYLKIRSKWKNRKFWIYSKTKSINSFDKDDTHVN